jgi:hypothetical protein
VLNEFTKENKRRSNAIQSLLAIHLVKAVEILRGVYDFPSSSGAY